MGLCRRAGVGAVLTAAAAGCTVLAWAAVAQQNVASQDSSALFARIATVLQSPRCLNCHTSTNFPRQGDDRHAHIFFVERGPDNRGLPWARCTSCHGEAN